MSVKYNMPESNDVEERVTLHIFRFPVLVFPAHLHVEIENVRCLRQYFKRILVHGIPT